MYKFSQLLVADIDQMSQLLKKIKQHQVELCLWQKEQETGGERIVATGRIAKVSKSSDLIVINRLFEPFRFQLAPTLYVYIDGIALLFQVNLRDCNTDRLSIYFPKKITKAFTHADRLLFAGRLADLSDSDMVLEAIDFFLDSYIHRASPFQLDELNSRLAQLATLGKLKERLLQGEQIDFVVEKYSLDELLAEEEAAKQQERDRDKTAEISASEKLLNKLEVGEDGIEIDDEERFKQMRETPRQAPKSFKTVVLMKERGISEAKEYVLYDLSQGGMAFNTWDVHEFKKDDELIISRIGEKRLKQKLRGVVRSVRRVTKISAEVKVGVQFI